MVPDGVGSDTTVGVDVSVGEGCWDGVPVFDSNALADKSTMSRDHTRDMLGILNDLDGPSGTVHSQQSGFDGLSGSEWKNSVDIRVIR